MLNVGCALHHLGAPSKSLCLTGGITGQQIQNDFRSLNVPVCWIPSQIPSRICTTILDESTQTTTELVENSHPIPADELEAFFQAFVEESLSADVIVLSGSLPSGTPVTFYRRLMEQVTTKVVLDIRGPELEEVLNLKPFVVKPNREELARTVARDLSTEEDLVSAMDQIRQRGAEWVVVSQGAGPLLALGPEGLMQVDPPRVEVCNPIGCGDCLAAGIAAAIDRRYSMRDAIQIGVKAAAENARELLPARKLTRIS